MTPQPVSHTLPQKLTFGRGHCFSYTHCLGAANVWKTRAEHWVRWKDWQFSGSLLGVSSSALVGGCRESYSKATLFLFVWATAAANRGFCTIELHQCLRQTPHAFPDMVELLHRVATLTWHLRKPNKCLSVTRTGQLHEVHVNVLVRLKWALRTSFRSPR